MRRHGYQFVGVLPTTQRVSPEYLAAKYIASDARRARALARVERLAADLSAAMAALKEQRP